MKRIFFKLVLVAIIFSGKLYSQIPTGEWRDHLSYNNVQEIEIVGSRVYCASTSALFYYDKDDKSLNRKSKINGLSDLNVRSIAYCDKEKTLVIGYANGNIDLLKDDKVYNLPDIKDKIIIADKTIRDISVFDDIAYVSIGFGIVKVDIAKREISDTYIIGDNGNYLSVNYVGVVFDSIYALTDQGIYKSNVDNLFLSYYGSWTKDTTISNWDASFNSGAIVDNKLYAVSNSNGRGVVSELVNSKWNIAYDLSGSVESLSESNNLINVSQKNNVSSYTLVGNLVNSISVDDATYAVIDNDDKYFIASSVNGLVFDNGNGEYEGHYPNGPIYSSFRMGNNGSQIISVLGGYANTGANSYYGAGFCSMSDEYQTWSNYNGNEYPIIGNVNDVSAIGSTGKEGDYYIGSWGAGLVEVKNNEVVKVYNEDNTNGVLTTNKTIYCGVSDIIFDQQGNLWLTQRNLEKPFFVKTVDGKWFNYGYSNLMVKELTGAMLNAKNDDIWIISPRGGGIGVINSNGTVEDQSDDEYNSFLFIDADGNLISDDLYCIVEDHDGDIWIGSANGIGIYENPSDIISESSPKASLPQQEIDGFLHSLLKGEVVKSIVVDGANRKWIGTSGGGLFLVSSDGTKQILNFNEDNSLLFSDDIKTLAMNPRNGELFIGTEKGIQSYMTTSSEANISFSDVYAFPNPVPPNYLGVITVRGLMYETNVKVTDVSGNIVYENESNGGDFVWNGRDMSGNIVKTGLYIVMCATQDGGEAEATKILFVK